MMHHVETGPTSAAQPSPLIDNVAASDMASQQDTRAALQRQVEFYLSRENLSTDVYLVTHMNSKMWVPISIIASFPLIRALTTDVNVIAEVMRQSNSVLVDETATMLRPNFSVSRSTIILRDIPPSIPVDAIRALFERAPKEVASAGPKDIRPDIGDTWFLTFDDEDDARRAFEFIRVQTFLDKPIKARIKSENLLKSVGKITNHMQPVVAPAPNAIQTPYYPAPVPSMPPAPNVPPPIGYMNSHHRWPRGNHMPFSAPMWEIPANPDPAAAAAAAAAAAVVAAPVANTSVNGVVPAPGPTGTANFASGPLRRSGDTRRSGGGNGIRSGRARGRGKVEGVQKTTQTPSDGDSNTLVTPAEPVSVSNVAQDSRPHSHESAPVRAPPHHQQRHHHQQQSPPQPQPQQQQQQQQQQSLQQPQSQPQQPSPSSAATSSSTQSTTNGTQAPSHRQPRHRQPQQQVPQQQVPQQTETGTSAPPKSGGRPKKGREQGPKDSTAAATTTGAGEKEGHGSKRQPQTQQQNRHNVQLKPEDFPPLPPLPKLQASQNGYAHDFTKYSKHDIVDVIRSLPAPEKLTELPADCPAVLATPQPELELTKPLPKTSVDHTENPSISSVKSFAEAAITAKDVRGPERPRHNSLRKNAPTSQPPQQSAPQAPPPAPSSSQRSATTDGGKQVSTTLTTPQTSSETVNEEGDWAVAKRKGPRRDNNTNTTTTTTTTTTSATTRASF